MYVQWNVPPGNFCHHTRHTQASTSGSEAQHGLYTPNVINGRGRERCGATLFTSERAWLKWRMHSRHSSISLRGEKSNSVSPPQLRWTDWIRQRPVVSSSGGAGKVVCRLGGARSPSGYCSYEPQIPLGIANTTESRKNTCACTQYFS